MTIGSQFSARVAATVFSLLFASVLEAGQLVTYERTPEGGDASVVDLFKKTYGDAAVDPSSSLTTNRFNAFRYFQYALAEMMVDPEALAKSRSDFQQNRTVWDGNSYGPNPKGWGYMYWNRGDTEAKTPLADGTGNEALTVKFSPEVGMEGKNIYFPDTAVLDKIVQLLRAQKELGTPMGPSDGQPQSAVDNFNTQAEKLDQQFLAILGAEIPGLLAAANGQKVYGLGIKYDSSDAITPLELNLPMIQAQLRRLGVPIPDKSDSSNANKDKTQAASTTKPSASEMSTPAIRVRQPQAAAQLMNQDYEALTQPGLDETARTKAEMDGDMFRIRTRPEDLKPGVKSYDLLSSPELPASGLSLPSRLPGGQ